MIYKKESKKYMQWSTITILINFINSALLLWDAHIYKYNDTKKLSFSRYYTHPLHTRTRPKKHAVYI